jgi:hypothetical protein
MFWEKKQSGHANPKPSTLLLLAHYVAVRAVVCYLVMWCGFSSQGYVQFPVATDWGLVIFHSLSFSGRNADVLLRAPSLSFLCSS